MINLKSEQGVKLVTRAMWVAANYLGMEGSGLPRKSFQLVEAKLDGIAEAADAMNLVMTPFAFKLAVMEAVRQVGQPQGMEAVSAQRAQEARAGWQDAVYQVVMEKLA